MLVFQGRVTVLDLQLSVNPLGSAASLLVPALTVMAGRAAWWPSHPGAGRPSSGTGPEHRPAIPASPASPAPSPAQ